MNAVRAERSDDEIIAFFETVKKLDFLGTYAGDLITRLSFAKAKPYLKPEAKEAEWEVRPRDRESVIAEMREYMDFAWEKALGHRGISAGRSIDHFKAWLWLLGDDETKAFLDGDENYSQYGVPCLKKVCDVYGFKMPDDEAAKNMAEGRPCHPDCEEGCGR